MLPKNIPNIVLSNGKHIEQVLNYKYVGWILSFKAHIMIWSLNSWVKLEFVFRNNTCFSLRVRRKMMTATWTFFAHSGLSGYALFKCVNQMSGVLGHCFIFSTEVYHWLQSSHSSLGIAYEIKHALRSSKYTCFTCSVGDWIPSAWNTLQSKLSRHSTWSLLFYPQRRTLICKCSFSHVLLNSQPDRLCEFLT